MARNVLLFCLVVFFKTGTTLLSLSFQYLLLRAVLVYCCHDVETVNLIRDFGFSFVREGVFGEQWPRSAWL